MWEGGGLHRVLRQTLGSWSEVNSPRSEAGLEEKAGSSVEGAEVPAGLGLGLGGVGQAPTQAPQMPTVGSGWPRITMSQTVHMHTSLRCQVRWRKYLPQTSLRVELSEI